MKDLRADRDGFVGALIAIVGLIAVLVLLVGNYTILGFNLDSWLGSEIGGFIGWAWGGFWHSIGL